MFPRDFAYEVQLDSPDRYCTGGIVLHLSQLVDTPRNGGLDSITTPHCPGLCRFHGLTRDFCLPKVALSCKFSGLVCTAGWLLALTFRCIALEDVASYLMDASRTGLQGGSAY